MKRKRPTVLIVAAAFALAGWLLPSLWLPGETERARNHIRPQSPEAAGAWKSLTGQINAAGSAMQQFQAVAASVAGRGRSLLDASGPLTGLNCEEAEELALRLAASDLGLNVKNGAEFLRSLKSSPFRVQASALAAWVEHDPDAALRTLFTPEGIKLASSCDPGLLRRLAEHDPGKALQILRSTASPATGGWSAVTAVLAQKDPAVALETLETAPFGARRAAMEGILATLSEKDPQAALEWTKTLTADQRKLVSWQAVFSKWAEADPAAAAAAWETTDKEGLRDYWQLAQHWAAKDPEGGIRWASESGACPDAGYYTATCMRALVTQDPQKALAMLATVKEPQREQSLRSIAASWGSADFPAALAWAGSLTKAGEKDAAFSSLSGLAGQLPEADRRALIEAAGMQSASAFRVLWNSDPGEAMRNFASLPAAKQTETWQQIYGTLSFESPQTVAKMADLMMEKGNSPLGASASDSQSPYSPVPRMVSTWAQSDAAGAGAWVSKLPEGEALSWAASNLVAVWSRNDLEAAAAWTEKLPDGPAKDKALSQLTNTSGGAGDPAAALKWGASIHDANQRQQTLQNYFSVLSRTDPAAARAVVESLPIDAGEKAGLLGTGKK